MEHFNLVYWDSSYNPVLLLNLSIAVALFACLRLFSGAISHVSANHELFKKDNPAFGISVAGVAFGITIVLTGAVYGEPVNNFGDSIVAVGLYGLLGIVLMWLSRIIFDRLAFSKISIRDEIIKGNVAAGIIDAGNVVASALVIRAVMTWVESNTIEGLTAVVLAFVISQILLTMAIYARIHFFQMNNDGRSIQEELAKGNKALALRFVGRRIGIAFAINAAANVMVYEIYDYKALLVAWILVSILMMIILSVISFIADKIIFFKVDVRDEVVNQKNIAVGALQCVIYLSMGFLLSELMA